MRILKNILPLLIPIFLVLLLIGKPDKKFNYADSFIAASELQTELLPNRPEQTISLSSYSKGSQFTVKMPEVPSSEIKNIVFTLSYTSTGTDVMGDYVQRRDFVLSKPKLVKESSASSLYFASSKTFVLNSKKYNRLFEVEADGDISEILSLKGLPLFVTNFKSFTFDPEIHKKIFLFKLEVGSESKELSKLKNNILSYVDLVFILKLESVKLEDSVPVVDFSFAKDFPVEAGDLIIAYGVKSGPVVKNKANKKRSEPAIKWLGSVITSLTQKKTPEEAGSRAKVVQGNVQNQIKSSSSIASHSNTTMQSSANSSSLSSSSSSSQATSNSKSSLSYSRRSCEPERIAWENAKAHAREILAEFAAVSTRMEKVYREIKELSLKDEDLKKQYDQCTTDECKAKLDLQIMQNVLKMAQLVKELGELAAAKDKLEVMLNEATAQVLNALRAYEACLEDQ